MNFIPIHLAFVQNDTFSAHGPRACWLTSFIHSRRPRQGTDHIRALDIGDISPKVSQYTIYTMDILDIKRKTLHRMERP